MGLLSAAEIKKIEKRHLEGIGSAEVVAIFRDKGQRFSEATLRKYVQLGLLPKSRRVGARGRHRGSSGRYPVTIVRQINDIKRALDVGATLDEIRFGQVGLAGEVETLQRAMDRVIGCFREAITRQEDSRRGSVLKKDLEKHRTVLERETRALERFAAKLGGVEAKS